MAATGKRRAVILDQATKRTHKKSPDSDDGHDTRAIQAYLGHRSIMSTVRYTALTPNAMEELFRNRCDIEIGQLAALVARFSERGSSIGEVPRTKLSIIAAKASGSSCVVR